MQPSHGRSRSQGPHNQPGGGGTSYRAAAQPRPSSSNRSPTAAASPQTAHTGATAGSPGASGAAADASQTPSAIQQGPGPKEKAAAALAAGSMHHGGSFGVYVSLVA